MRKSLIWIVSSCLLLSGCGERNTASVAELQRNFQNPPQEARPMVWWHWMNGNITKDGIKKDLEWMHRSGIRGFHHFDAALQTPQVVDERLVYMTPQWQDAFRYAIHVADSLGMEVGIASSPGWSHTGGPWVKPRDGMKKLVWKEVMTDGSRHFHGALPEPIKTSGPFMNAGAESMGLDQGGQEVPEYYEDIAVVAIRIPEDEATWDGGTPVLCDENLQTGFSLPQKDGFYVLDYVFETPVTVASVTVGDKGGRGTTTLLADGEPVADIPSNSSISQQTVTFAPVTARVFTLRITSAQVNPILASFGLGGSGEAPFITEFRLSSVPRIHLAETKAGFSTLDGLGKYPTPDCERDFSAEAIDLTAHYKDGVLDWEVPEGRWKIYRFGWSLTGKENHPAPPEATGLEVDKLDPAAWTAYFDRYLDMYQEANGGSMKGIDYILTDSYEAGCETWTPAMTREFETRRGYALLPWMPVLTGEIIGSVARSEQFLRDWRQTLEELVAENFDRLTEIAQAHGLKGRYSESHENQRSFVADGMDIKRTATVPMSAIWMPSSFAGSSIPTAIADMRESASVSHIYGQPVVAAESMTSVGMFGLGYSYWPGNLKPVADLEFASGVNRIIVHESAHQPLDDKFPGLGLSVTGQWFNRHETWAELAHVWTDYLARTSYMMQQGRNVADILVYYGDDSNVCMRYGQAEIDLPKGYNYDFLSTTALLNEISYAHGSFKATSGNSWRILVVDADKLSAPVQAKLDAWMKAGARICTLQGLDLSGIDEDVLSSADIRFVHKTLADGQYYWVSNPAGDFTDMKLTFRATDRFVSMWDPETGTVIPVDCQVSGSRTSIRWKAEPHDAKFFVFTDKAMVGQNNMASPKPDRESALEGPWTVRFQEGRGAPAETVLDELQSWTDSDEPGIRYFSGTACYSNTFQATEGRWMLDLGEVHNMAEVLVNGKPVRILWKKPYQADITDYVHPGDNTLEVRVTNLWPNRLIRDAQLPESERITYTGYPFYGPDEPLRPAGLLGPVVLYH